MGFSKEHKSPTGGLTEAGRKYFNNKDGGNLKPPVKSGVNARRVPLLRGLQEWMAQ